MCVYLSSFYIHVSYHPSYSLSIHTAKIFDSILCVFYLWILVDNMMRAAATPTMTTMNLRHFYCSKAMSATPSIFQVQKLSLHLLRHWPAFIDLIQSWLHPIPLTWNDCIRIWILMLSNNLHWDVFYCNHPRNPLWIKVSRKREGGLLWDMDRILNMISPSQTHGQRQHAASPWWIVSQGQQQSSWKDVFLVSRCDGYKCNRAIRF